MKETKIQFSDREIDLLSNAEIILTKNKALEKVKAMLEEVAEMQMDFISKKTLLLNMNIFKTPAKISKGENYLGLPYLVLDYPRNFSNHNIFAIRTMFWWGRSFSTTLHLSGEYLQMREQVSQHFKLLQAADFLVCINQDQWVHHFEDSNYKAVRLMNEKEFGAILEELPHIKIAANWPLSDWHDAATNLFEGWKKLMAIAGLIS